MIYDHTHELVAHHTAVAKDRKLIAREMPGHGAKDIDVSELVNYLIIDGLAILGYRMEV